MEVKIVETRDYLELAPLFQKSGLEVSLTEPPVHSIACYKVVDEEGKILGGVSVEHKVGIYTIGDIAVEESCRDLDIGSMLLTKAMERIKDEGGKEIFLVAKAPKFFEKFGFDYITREETPDFTNCLKCDKFQVSCFPELMHLDKIK